MNMVDLKDISWGCDELWKNTCVYCGGSVMAIHNKSYPGGISHLAGDWPYVNRYMNLKFPCCSACMNDKVSVSIALWPGRSWKDVKRGVESALRLKARRNANGL